MHSRDPRPFEGEMFGSTSTEGTGATDLNALYASLRVTLSATLGERVTTIASNVALNMTMGRNLGGSGPLSLFASCARGGNCPPQP